MQSGFADRRELLRILDARCRSRGTRRSRSRDHRRPDSHRLGSRPWFQHGGLCVPDRRRRAARARLHPRGWIVIESVKERGYTGKCYVPHDISVKSFESGRTRIQTLVSVGMSPVHVPMHSVLDRINAAQLTIPRCRFNSIKCKHGLAGLREYCRDWDDRLKVFKDTPKHNWASHAADSFGYMAMGYKQTAKPEPTPRPPLYKPLSAMSYDEFDDDIEITYQGTKIIRADRRPRRPDRV